MLKNTLVLVALAVSMSSASVFAGDFDGTWTGKWSEKSTAKIRVVDDKVVSYSYKGEAQDVGGTKRKGKKLVFGSDYRITLSLTGKDSAHASYRQGSGSAEADLKR